MLSCAATAQNLLVVSYWRLVRRPRDEDPLVALCILGVEAVQDVAGLLVVQERKQEVVVVQVPALVRLPAGTQHQLLWNQTTTHHIPQPMCYVELGLCTTSRPIKEASVDFTAFSPNDLHEVGLLLLQCDHIKRTWYIKLSVSYSLYCSNRMQTIWDKIYKFIHTSTSALFLDISIIYGGFFLPQKDVVWATKEPI